MKILVISSNLIGDTILSTGVIDYFLTKNPTAKFTFCIGPSAAQIYEHFPSLDKIEIIEKKKFNMHWIKMYLNCRKTKWDIVIDLRSSLISYFFNTKKRYIFKKIAHLHHIEQLNKFFNIKTNPLNIYTSIEEEKKVIKNINQDYKNIVIFPGGNWTPKIWPIDSYNGLLKQLYKKYLNVIFIIVGSKEEKKLYLESIKKDLPDDIFIDIMGANLTLTSAYMKKSQLFIGNDSGLTHLSFASNLNTIGLFGPTNDQVYGHRDKKNFVIRTIEDYDYNDRDSINKNKTYMRSIKIEKILDVINKNKLI